MVRLTDQLSGPMCALEVQMRVVLPCDADSAMELNGLGGNVVERVRAVHPGGVGERERFVGSVDECVDGCVGDGMRGLGECVHVGHPVLECLE